ncbi:sigma-54-dependent Fis family transcriptional regulator [Siminovitchia acidinfaciens]|uniref:Sigma-54-dependent Fis family transcriptional regulator n=1 Tax=Siminovitchia acidinfaciens TaxID=2321395 RepID=A0A429XZW4_9BACI|nr:transporter substrate-binding protein [Siminovitchia acidinfaciens]RST74313.1 sigma-54-dependent Fis family transcriptional regulator [Siminovitchia acidinfaciens]
MQIKVGLLFSLTGTTSITEKGQYEAARFAINEYNNQHAEIEAVVRDIRSDPRKSAGEAEALARDGVRIFIGCYTSACRKAVLPVMEKYDCLLVYPTLYEGQEDHPNVFYTGEVPNQQVHVLIDYFMRHYGKRIYLIGNDYIYPRKTNEQVKAYATAKNGEVTTERYVPFGHQDFHEVIQDIILKKPDVVFSTLVGKSVPAFYRTYSQMGLDPETAPIFSPITKETEIEAMGAEFGAGHYSSASYFQSLSNPLNQSFVQRFYRFSEAKIAVSSVMYNTYLGTKIVLDSILKTKACDRKKITGYIGGKRMDTACGTLRVDAKGSHLSRPVRIGKALPDGQFDIVWDSDKNIKPEPFKISTRKEGRVNEIVLEAWGQISEEAIIALSDNGTIQYLSRKAEELTGLGRGDRLTKKMIRKLYDTFQVTSHEARKKQLLLLKPRIGGSSFPVMKFGRVRTRNEQYQLELETARIAAQSNANVLILGETGTGKEVVARSIHEMSDRRVGPLISVNTGLIPKNLIASELFGYVEGTFTGARKGGAIGKFEAAHNGTLFLDEIGDMPMDLQVILLRALETKRIVRLGDTKEREVDIRIIAATNRNLPEEIAYGNTFRTDLFYRLNVLSLTIPPLRERPEDIEGLVIELMRELEDSYVEGPERVSGEALQMLVEYPWPGNIRELRNVIERAYLLARGHTGEIQAGHLPSSLRGYASRKSVSQLSLREVEKETILKALRKTKNVLEAAKELGIARSTLYRKIKEFEISV